MLKNISPLLTPELLKMLAEMGHGDEIVIGDANFPATSMGQRCARQDGQGGVALLDAILALLPLLYLCFERLKVRHFLCQ